MHASQPLIAALLILSVSTGKAVVGPQYHEQSDDTPKVQPSHPAPVTPKASKPKLESVDQIKGVGKFKFGSHVADYPVTLLQIVDHKAKGVLLRVSPYGDNYLVTDVKDLTWGGVPVKGMVLTFHNDVLIDFQIALKAKRGDLYVANQAFKAKYGPSDPTTFPIQTWTGDQIQVTLMFPASQIPDAKAVDAPGQGRVEILDQARWKKFEAVKAAELKKILDQRYDTAAKKAQDNL